MLLEIWSTSADFGVSTGLFDASSWNISIFHWINVEAINTETGIVSFPQTLPENNDIKKI